MGNPNIVGYLQDQDFYPQPICPLHYAIVQNKTRSIQTLLEITNPNIISGIHPGFINSLELYISKCKERGQFTRNDYKIIKFLLNVMDKTLVNANNLSIDILRYSSNMSDTNIEEIYDDQLVELFIMSGKVDPTIIKKNVYDQIISPILCLAIKVCFVYPFVKDNTNPFAPAPILKNNVKAKNYCKWIEKLLSQIDGSVLFENINYIIPTKAVIEEIVKNINSNGDSIPVYQPMMTMLNNKRTELIRSILPLKYEKTAVGSFGIPDIILSYLKGKKTKKSRKPKKGIKKSVKKTRKSIKKNKKKSIRNKK